MVTLTNARRQKYRAIGSNHSRLKTSWALRKDADDDHFYYLDELHGSFCRGSDYHSTKKRTGNGTIGVEISKSTTISVANQPDTKTTGKNDD